MRTPVHLAAAALAVGVAPEGTVAVAVTMIFVQPTGTMVEEERSFEMRVDRPFALAVRHHGTGAVLFAAWVDDPTAGGR